MKKKHSDIKQYLNKGISTLVGILVVLLVAVAAGLLMSQFSPEGEIPSPPPIVTPDEPTPTPSPSPSPTPTPLPTPESYIKVISPNGGEEWEIGKTYTIKWESEGYNKVDIQLNAIDISSQSDFGGIIVRNIIADTGYYSWIASEIEGAMGDRYKITIIDSLCLNVDDAACANFDQGDNYFSIATKDETADWKTYTNDKYGYEFSYSENAKIVEEDNNQIEIALPFLQEGTNLRSKTLSVQIVETKRCDYAYSYYTEEIEIDNVIFKKYVDHTGGTQTVGYSINYETKRIVITQPKHYLCVMKSKSGTKTIK